MKFGFKKNNKLVLIYFIIQLICLVLSSLEDGESETIVQTQLTRPDHEKVDSQRSNLVLDSNLMENSEGVTFVWIKRRESDLGGSSESLLEESRNETSAGARQKRNINSVHYYEIPQDEMPWKYADSVYDEPPEDKQKVVKAGIILLAALIGKILLKLAKLFLVTLAASPLLIVPGLLYTSFLAGIFLGRLFQARNLAVATPGTTLTTTTTTVSPGTGMGMADLWTGPNLSGAGAAISAPIGTCVDFPPVFDKMLQSMDTKNSCVIICDTAGCVGTCIRFMNAGIVNDLGSFNNMASSIMFC